MALDLLRGHDEFRRKYLGDERDFLQHLASAGQSPAAIYIGCSDSRVVPEVLTASSPGDLFVVRNVANLVPRLEHTDASVGAALEYAVGHLHVPHLIVCGHVGCGGIGAVIEGLEHVASMPSLHEWLELARPAVEHARETGLTGDELWQRAVEENVVEQLEHVLSYRSVGDALVCGELQLHGWVYDLHTLELTVLDRETGAFEPARRILERSAPPSPG
jgi:carbonic anhydrase